MWQYYVLLGFLVVSFLLSGMTSVAKAETPDKTASFFLAWVIIYVPFYGFLVWCLMAVMNANL